MTNEKWKKVQNRRKQKYPQEFQFQKNASGEREKHSTNQLEKTN